MFFHKLGANGIAQFAGTAALFFAGWLIYAQISLCTAFPVETTVADSVRGGLVAWNCVLFDFSGDGRRAFLKDTGYGFDRPPSPEQVLQLTAFLIC